MGNKETYQQQLDEILHEIQQKYSQEDIKKFCEYASYSEKHDEVVEIYTSNNTYYGN